MTWFLHFDQFYSSILSILLLLEWKSCLDSFKKRILIHIMCNFNFIVRYKFRGISISFHVKLIHIFLDEFDCVDGVVWFRLICIWRHYLKWNYVKMKRKKIHNLNGMHVVLFSTQFTEKKLAQNNVNHLDLYARK